MKVLLSAHKRATRARKKIIKSVENCSEPANDTISQLVLRRLFDDNYNKNTVPLKTSATVVSIEFGIQNIAQVSEISASFTLDLLFSQIWHDPRLRFDHITSCLQNLTLGYSVQTLN